MFNCGFCGETTKSSEHANRVVTETRYKQYTQKRYRKVIRSEGFETVKEALVCGSCFEIKNPSEHKEVN